VQIDYDPNRISYSQLLDIFWQSHKPQQHSWSRQYMKAVFYHDEEQRLQAETSKANLAQQLGSKVGTAVVPLKSFTLAEDYHQKFYLKNNAQLEKELLAMYPQHGDLVDSTAAARLNGYVGGYGTKEQLSREIEGFGLSPDAEKRLTELIRK
jgi:hypothetical protein